MEQLQDLSMDDIIFTVYAVFAQGEIYLIQIKIGLYNNAKNNIIDLPFMRPNFRL